MLACTEARVTEDVTEAELKMDGYRTIRSDATSRYSGGVVIYYKDDLKITDMS